MLCNCHGMPYPDCPNIKAGSCGQPPERTYTASEVVLERAAMRNEIANCLRDGKVEFSRNHGEPEPSAPFPVRYVLPMEPWNRLQDIVLSAIPTDQPALDRHDAEHEMKWLRALGYTEKPQYEPGYEGIGVLFGDSPYIEKWMDLVKEKEAQTAAMREIASEHIPMVSLYRIDCKCGWQYLRGYGTAEFEREWQAHIRAIPLSTDAPADYGRSRSMDARLKVQRKPDCA